MASQTERGIRQITEDKVISIISLDWEWQERKKPISTRLGLEIEPHVNSHLLP
jgi:hypothetical protein